MMIKSLLIAGIISLTLNSCFLFRSKSERCPAYGQELKQQNDKNVDLKTEQIQFSEEA